ncbi:MAG: hypothetical protein HY720_19625, partial [Planctomycetes bacterium]|nr:hypothetical protein [Planctomycetota bacterium]
ATLVHPLDQAGPSDQLHAYFISRLDRVSFHCRRVLTLSAVMGESFATKDLERLHRRMESSSLEFRRHAKEAVEEGILVEAQRERFAFYHPLMKRATSGRGPERARGRTTPPHPVALDASFDSRVFFGG